MKPWHLLFPAAAIFFSGQLMAQTPTSATSRAEQARAFSSDGASRNQSSQAFTPMMAEQAPSSPGDPDLGEQVILKRREKPTPFSVFADASGYYTSNAALTESHTVSDYFLVSQVGASYQPRLATDLLGEVTIRQAFFRYADLSDLDFDSLNVGAGVTYIVRPLWGVAFSARYNFNRLTDGSEHEEFFKNQTLTLGLLKTVELTKAHYLYAGYSTIFGWSDPVAPQRDEHGIFLGYHANMTRSLAGDLYYRAALFDYVNGREDWNQNLVGAVKWSPNKWVNLSVALSVAKNNSDRDVFDYEVLNTGLGLAGSVAF